jgi:hypothetical protein
MTMKIVTDAWDASGRSSTSARAIMRCRARPASTWPRRGPRLRSRPCRGQQGPAAAGIRAGPGDAVGFVTRPIHRSSDRSGKPLHGSSWRHD